MYNYDWESYDKELMEEFNWFLYKINERACIQRGFLESEYSPVNRNKEFDHGLQEHVEYFHPTITLDDRMRYIAEYISNLDTSLYNIIGNTLISHFYGARGIHKTLIRKTNLNDCFVDFERLLCDDLYYRELDNNIELAKENKLPIWGTTELHTSIQTAARNFCRVKYNNPDRKFKTIDVLEWVASFIENNLLDELIQCKNMKEAYKALTKQRGIGEYYGFHGAASTSVLPQLEYHHDQRFVAPGPGARYTIKKLWPDAPKKLYAESIYFLRENAEKVGLTSNVDFHKNAYNIVTNYKNIFNESQDSLKYYGTEVLCCQFGVYLQIRDNPKSCNRRKVSRAE